MFGHYTSPVNSESLGLLPRVWYFTHLPWGTLCDRGWEHGGVGGEKSPAQGRPVSAQPSWSVAPEKSRAKGGKWVCLSVTQTTANPSCMVIASHWKISKPEVDIRFLFKDGHVHRWEDSTWGVQTPSSLDGIQMESTISEHCAPISIGTDFLEVSIAFTLSKEFVT